MEAVCYAIIDGAVEEGLLGFLANENPPHCCLYAEPIQAELISLAPYLVEVTTSVREWLDIKTTPWGMYLTSELSLKELQQHFRRYLWVLLPEQEKPVLMRFYDPRNIWVLTDVLTPHQLFSFITPVSTFSTVYEGKTEKNDFSSVRASVAVKTRKEHSELLSLTHRQYSRLEQQAQNNYLDALSIFITNNAAPPP